jgi:hypothetical protein
MKTTGLVHDTASMEVNFYDEDRKLIESFKSETFQNLPTWRDVEIGPITPGNEAVRWAVISLHLTPSDRADLVGSASFDAISFGRMPRMSLSTNSEHNIYSPVESVEITCQLSGFKGSEPLLRFELRDVDGNVLDSHTEKLQATAKTASPGSTGQTNSRSGDDQDDGSLGTSKWEPNLPRNGFYQVRVIVDGVSGLTRNVNLVRLDSLQKRVKGEFGWSLPDGDKTLPLRTLAPLLGKVGINWIKFPFGTTTINVPSNWPGSQSG